MRTKLSLFLLFVPILLCSQTSLPKNTQKTVEDVYLQSTVEVQVVRSLANEIGRNEKVKALDYIAKMVETGKATDKSIDVVALLEQLGGEGTTTEVRQNGRLINDYPDVRRQAAELLGQVGGDKAREVLLAMALGDPEPMVVSEAVYSLGLIGGGDQGARIETVITSLIKTQDAIRPDSNFAFAAVSCLEMLGKKNNGKVSSEVFAALIRIQNGNYITPVRKKAEAVLSAFTKY